MPRKNSRVRWRNSRREKFWDPDVPFIAPATPTRGNRLAQIVIPDGRCPLHRRQKDRYDTIEKAQAAMRQINRARKDLPESRKVKRVYKCPGEGCGGFHLTSRTEFDEAQSRMIHERKNHINEESA